MRASLRRALVALLLAVAAVTPCTSFAQGTTAGGTTPVPALALRTLTGDTVRIGAGSPSTLVAVFASWCRSCKDEVATFNRLHRELASQGVRLVAVSADEGPDERLQAWLVRFGATYLVVRDPSGAALKALGVVGVPEAFLVGADGRIAWSRRGPIESGLPALRRAVATAGKPVERPAGKSTGNPARD